MKFPDDADSRPVADKSHSEPVRDLAPVDPAPSGHVATAPGQAQHGWIDICLQSHIHGWAADGDLKPIPVTIAVSGRPPVVVAPNLPRFDLQALGRDLMSGFRYTFPEPLSLDDEVVVTTADGTPLRGSPSTTHRARLAKLLDGIDLAATGIEIGALDRPLLSKKRSGVLYVDHASRAGLLAKYAPTGPGEFDPEAVRDVDIVWPTGPLRPLLPDGRLLSYCLAAGVIEHIPDMIGWLKAISDALVPGGIVNLAVPDMERTFDRRRALTGLSALIGAHIERRTRPSAAQIFDHVAYAVLPGIDAPPNLPAAFGIAHHTETTREYLDVHCHVFTQQSFLEIMGQITRLGLLDFALRRYDPTAPDDYEFIVSLEKSDRDAFTNAATFFAAIPAA